MNDYFVTYTYSTNGVEGVGRCLYRRDKPIAGMSDIFEMENNLQEQKRTAHGPSTTLLIVGWQRFEKAE